MNATKYLNIVQEDIHSVIVATVDHDGLPVTCAIDIMDSDDDSLYFLTAKGKNFYQRLKDKEYLSLTGMKGEDTMSCVAISIRGKVREIGSDTLEHLFHKNPYMNEIYPDKQSRSALTVFQLYEGTGEWFDLSSKPIERASFSFGGVAQESGGYYITNQCTGCKKCYEKCPQKCIDFSVKPAEIIQSNCLHCGNCLDVCPVKAVERR